MLNELRRFFEVRLGAAVELDVIIGGGVRVQADGADGRVTIDFDSMEDYGTSVTVQSDGKILIAGYSGQSFSMSCHFAIARIAGGNSPASTSSEMIAHLLAEVETLHLNSGQRNSLTSKLRAGANPTAAVNQLNAFVNQLNAIVNSHRLGEITANSLINEVDDLVELIG